MTLRFYTQFVDAMRLSVVLVILFNPLGPALAEALRGDKLSTAEINDLLLSRSASDFIEGFSLLVEGLKTALDVVVSEAGELPLIGDQLVEGMVPLTQALDALYATTEESMARIYHDIETGADPLARFESGLFEIFGPDGIDLLLDGPDTGSDVNMTDIVRTSGREGATGPHWVQWDMHLGQKASLTLPFEFGFDFGALGGEFENFGLSVDASEGITFDFFWEIYLGFGLHGEDGFYLNSEAKNEMGDEVEELRAGIEAYAEPGERGEPGIALDANLGFLNGRITDGTRSRAQINAAEPVASAEVLAGSLVDYTRRFTLTLTGSNGVMTSYPISYTSHGEETFSDFLTGLNATLSAATLGEYDSPFPAVIALARPQVNSLLDPDNVGGPVLSFIATTPNIVAMQVEFDTGGDCVTEPTYNNDHCSWGFGERQYEDGRAQSLGFASGQTGGRQLTAAREAPVNGALAQDVDFTLTLTDRSGDTTVPVILRSLANADIASLADLRDRLDAYLNGDAESGSAGILSQRGIPYDLDVVVTGDNRIQFNCQPGTCSGLRVDYDPLDRSKLLLVFSIDISDSALPGSYRPLDTDAGQQRIPDGRLTSDEMLVARSSATLDTSFTPVFAAEANIRFHIESNMDTISGFIEQALGNDNLGLPELAYDLKMDVSATKPAGGEATTDVSIIFDNIALDLGGLIETIVQPMANILGMSLGPVLRVVGGAAGVGQSFLTKPIPLIEDIGPSMGIGQPSIMDTIAGSDAKEQLDEFFAALQNINRSMEGLTHFLAGYNGEPITFPCIQLDVEEGGVVVLQCELASLVDGLVLDELLASPEFNPGGFQLDILKPETVFQMILGNPFDIASYSLPTLDLHPRLGFGMNFDLLSFDANFGVDVHLGGLGVVYDSTGLEEISDAFRAGAAPDFGDLMDGFYLRIDPDERDLYVALGGGGRGEIGGIWEDWWGCKWGLEAGAEIELGGGFFLDANDLNDDGKLRLDEIMTLTDNFSNPLNTLCLFDAGVNIHGGFDFWGKACFCACASLSASDFGLGPLCKFDVDLSLSDILGPIVDCPADDSHGPPPILATPLPGCEHILRVNSGPFASQRLYGDTDDRDGVQLTIEPAAGGVRVSGFGAAQVYAGDFDRILVIGGKGDDQITVSSTLTTPVTLLGMDGDDTLTGGGAADLLDGGSGRDTLHGGPGDDLLDGGADNDALYGDAGQDVLHGGDGADDLYGGDDADRLYGDAGSDALHGGNGSDLLDGGRDNDALYGDAGRDVLNGNQGDDELHGGADADQLYGDAGADQLYGDADDDILHGDAGADELHGGGAADRLFGDSGFDVLNGDAGNDILHGGSGDDALDGGLDNDQLHGDAGDDTLMDGVGDDALYGGLGDDRVGVHALLGDTWLQGDAGFDTLIYDNTAVETTPLTPTLTGGTILAHYSVTATQVISARLYLNRPVTDVVFITVTESFSAAVYTLVEAISVTLGDDDDRFVVAGPALPLTITTGGGEDVITIDALSGPTTVDAGPGGHDTVLVHAINGPTTITTMGADFDVLASSRAHRLNLIRAALTVDGSGGGQTRLWVQETGTGATAHRPILLTGSALTVTSLGASGAVGYSGLDELVLDLGAGDDTLHAIGPSAARTTIDGGFGSNTLMLSPQSATFSRTLSTDHIWQVTVDNTVSPADAAWTLAASGATGVVTASTLNLTLLAAGVEQAALDLGPGVDTVAIQSIPCTATIRSGGGDDRFNVGEALMGPLPLTLDGQGGDDTLILMQDDPGSLATPYTSLDFGGIEIVHVDSSGSAAATDWVVDGNSSISAQAKEILDIAGRGVKVVRIEESAGGPDTLTWTNSPTGRMTIHGDAVRASASALEFSQIEALTLTTGAGGDDIVILRDVDAPLGLVAIHTGDGSDTVSVQKASPDQLTAVSLGAGQDTFYLRELDAGSATTVSGDSGDDVFHVNAASLDSAVVISGGLGADALLFDPQGYTATMTLPATPTGAITLTDGPVEPLSYTGMESAQILDLAPVVAVTPTTPTVVGESLIVAVSARVHPTGSVTYTWDLDGDGTFGDVPSKTGACTETVVFTVPWSALQTLGLGEAGEYVITARAVDSQSRSGEGSAAIIVAGTNRQIGKSVNWRIGTPASRSPVHHSAASDGLSILAATYAGPGDGLPVESGPVTVTVVAAGAPTYTYEFDWYGDGTDVVSYSTAANVGVGQHVYTDDGLYTLLVTVRDGSRPVSETAAVSETLLVRVANAAPHFSISGGPDSLNEGQTYSVALGAVSGDPGPDTVVSYTVSWGDGAVTTVASGTTVLTHTYADDGEFFITAAARDEDDVFPAQNTLAVTVTNVVPTLSLADSGTVDEGSPYTLTLHVSDPGEDTLTRWTIDWGDGWAETVGSGLTSTLHTYADNGEYLVSVTVTDEDGTYPAGGVLTRTATVRNVAPQISIAPSPDMKTPVPEGAWYKLDLIACGDPGRDTLTSWTIDWGNDLGVTGRGYTPYAVTGIDATSVITGNNPSQALHRFTEGPAVYTVTVISASDEDGVYTSTSQVRIEVSDTPPIITMDGPNAPLEGNPYTLTLEMIDPGADLVDRWEIDWGDGEQTVIPGALDPAQPHTYAEAHSITATHYITTHVYPDNGVYAVSVVMYQTNGLSATANLSATVRNVAPELYLTGQPSWDVGLPFTLTIGAVTDPGDDTVTEYRINWNDGSAVQTITVPGDVPHLFTDEQDIHLIRVSVVDEDIAGTDTGEYRSVGLLPVINEGALYKVPLSVNRVLTYADIVTTPGDLDMGLLGALDRGVISDTLRQLFASHGITLSENAVVAPVGHDPLVVDGAWQLVDAITLTEPITHVMAHTYTLQARMDAPTYISFAPLDIRFGYELDVHAEPTHTFQFSATSVILAQAAGADLGVLDDLDRGGPVSDELRRVFSDTVSATLSLTATVTPLVAGSQWRLDDRDQMYTVITSRDVVPTYKSFAPADIVLDYEISVYGDKRYQVDWGDGTTETYTTANDYEVFLDAVSLAPLTRYVFQLNAQHVYRAVGVYTVTFSSVDAAGQLQPFHSYPVVVNGKIHKTYLPLTARNYATAPDLVVRALIAASDNITVVIENRGNAPVNDGFWVMSYVDPDPIPNGVNQLWYYGYSDYGVSWAVDDPQLASLAPGGALTLTLEDASPPPYTRLPAALAAGTPVYAQVDAYHPDTDYGAVLELDEILGQEYNNIAATVSTGGTGRNILSTDNERQAASPQSMPLLPRDDSKRLLWSGKQQCVKFPGEPLSRWMTDLLPSIIREE